ncbi:hypothetical protein D9M73_207030 [compost metagenome]
MALPADFHADHQEEHRHQDVVDPEVQRVRDNQIADPEGQRQMPEMRVAAGVGGIGPDQRGGSRNQQDDAADGFDVKESFEGGNCLVGDTLRNRHPLGRRDLVHGRSYSAACVAARPTDETCPAAITA